MIKVALYNSIGERSGEVELPEEIFGIIPHEGVVHQYAKAYLANQRQGTHKTKTMSEVRGGGRKPWKQKGTGRARVGSIRSPLWRHGGVTFGPTPRDYRQRMPKKMKKLAMYSVLSDRVNDQRFGIIETPVLDIPSSQKALEIVNKTGLFNNEKVLIVTAVANKNLYLSLRNIYGIKVTHLGEFNTYQVLVSDNILFTQDALNTIKENWLK